MSKKTKNHVEHRAFTLEEKANLIEKFAISGQSKHKFSVENGLSRSTLLGILSDRELIFDALRTGISPMSKKLRMGKLREAENELVKWVKNKNSQHIAVTGNLVKEKAKQLAKKAKIRDFVASNQWMKRLKRRNKLKFKKISGESGSVDLEALEHFRKSELKVDLTRYPPHNIYNCDQFGLFFKLTPDRTLAVKGMKLSKERISVHLCTNMTGKDKRPLLAIGKARKPRCFRSQTVPVDYDASSTAWMNGAIFERWLTKWNAELSTEERYILLYADNFLKSFLTTLDLSHIELKFLPANSTSLSQPLDAGVIKDIKFKYKHALLKKMVTSLDNGKEYKIDLLNALRLLRDSWILVKEETIRNCFRHAHFIEEPLETEEDYDDAIDEIIELWESLKLIDKTDGAKLTDFIDLDDEIEDQPLLSDTELSNQEESHSDAEEYETNGFTYQPFTEEDELFCRRNAFQSTSRTN